MSHSGMKFMYTHSLISLAVSLSVGMGASRKRGLIVMYLGEMLASARGTRF